MILNSLNEDEPQSTYTEDFESFWKSFPVSDKHSHYMESRKIRGDKKNTYKNYLECLKEGYSASFLKIKLEEDVRQRTSPTNRDNALKFMKGPVKWLADRAFLEVETIEEETYVSNDNDLV